MTAKINADKFARSVDDAFKKLLESKNLFPGWANRELMPMYSDMQLKRWRSENADSGHKWNPLSETYAKRKRTKFANSPGRGRKILLASGRLLAGVIPPETRSALSVQGPEEEFRKLVTRKSITISTVVPYAKYVNETREFTSISDKIKRAWARDYLAYLVRGLRK